MQLATPRSLTSLTLDRHGAVSVIGSRRNVVDEDRMKGAATNVGGNVKDAVGGLIGDTKTQAEGQADQLSGTVQNAYGSAKDSRPGSG